MNNIIILLSSSTSAARLKYKLEEGGYKSTIIATPTSLASGGCSYSVLTSSTALSCAEKSIAVLGLSSRGIYLDTGKRSSERYRLIPSEEIK